MNDQVFAKLLERPADSHKYQYGHVLVVGGSPGMVGAPLLTGMAALRVGAGLVTIAAPADVTDKLERRVKEIMTLALPASGSEAALTDFIEDRKVSATVIGPGLKQTAETAALTAALLKSPVPLIIDGGALRPRMSLAASKPVILTPHPGEFRRLIGRDLPENRADLKPIAASFAEERGITLVLKGEPTYVVRPDGTVYENATGNPGLATAGTGDVLAGVIAGIIAQGVEASEAADAAVYLHGLAGDIAAAAKTQPGMIAGDVIDALPEALLRVSRGL